MSVQTNASEQRLLQALEQFHRTRWHEQPTVGGCKPSEIRVLFCIKNGAKPNGNGDRSNSADEAPPENRFPAYRGDRLVAPASVAV